MKSGLEDRNNWIITHLNRRDKAVSMKSGLEDRNNSDPMERYKDK